MRVWIRRHLTNLALMVFAVVITLVILEIASPLIYRVVRGRPFSRQAALATMGSAWYSPPEGTALNDVGMTYEHVLHPYVGFVGVHNPVQIPDGTRYVNSYGFNGPDPVLARGSGTLIVGIFGGSVANLLYQLSGRYVTGRLNALYPERQIKIVCGALAGYKQPQQLMALTYFLSLGCGFDVVINLDGFNEVTLPYEENVLAGVNPFFPRSWGAYARKALDRRTLNKVSEISRVQDRRASLVRVANSPFVRRSSLALMMLKALDGRALSTQWRLNAEIQAVLTEVGGRDFQVSGPSFSFTSLDQLYERLAAMWSRSSQQMARLGRSNGFRYYHFLQPNQYYQGSKVLTQDELRRAYLQSLPWEKAVGRGYPLLREAGQALSSGDVAFTDLTMLFRDVAGDIYTDNCCHYNEAGNAMVAEAIMDVIAADLRARGLAAAPTGMP